MHRRVNGNTQSSAQFATSLIGDTALRMRSLTLELGDWTLRVRSNRDAVIDGLAHYFAHVRSETGSADMEVLVIEREPPSLPALDDAFTDWQREPGKTGRKDSCLDLTDGRLVRKVRTGMLFLQSETHRIAAGPCLLFYNQVINFINAQFMNRLQQHGWLICHASGLVRDGATLAIAGLSGGGKSTLMLQLMASPGFAYLTNDRLFVKRSEDAVVATGIPKLPRINPGTIVHDERLQKLIPADQRAAYLAMPAQELWELEDKHDVFIDQVYGAGRIVPRAALVAFLVLNWQRESTEPMQLDEVDLAGRPDLLGAIMKSPGPFYQYADGRFFADGSPFDERAYLAALAGVPVYEASGVIDFRAMSDRLEQLQWWERA